jgi:AraC family transcriptional regulator
MALAGEDGEAFFEELRRDGGLRVGAGDARTLRAARELEEALLAPHSLPLLREAKSLELLACMIEDRRRLAQDGTTLPRTARDRLQHARERLLRDMADPPTLQQLADECGLNTFALKRGFKQLFGEPVFTLLQRERMRMAWELIASGRMSAAEAGSRVGYRNMSHFGAAFRRVHGVLPGEVRRLSLAPRFEGVVA